MPLLKMLTGLCGPDFSLVRNDEREFDEREASSLIRAGFAVAVDGFEPIALDEPTNDEADADAAADKAKADEEAAAKAEADAAEAKAAEEAAAAKRAPAKRKG